MSEKLKKELETVGKVISLLSEIESESAQRRVITYVNNYLKEEDIFEEDEI